ncbi:MAG: nicotinate-nucleotide adenylyltransferase [Planctomycetota bacterium]|nr:nicotinate-nucleotide adenylyltransferase [Planctomycetota bacterium]
MKLGVYGGTFDPLHNGHLSVARAAREAHDLDRVLLVPAARAPHKRRTLSPAGHRLAMVRLAVEGEDGLEASDLEIARGGVSYTVDTLETLAHLDSAAEIFLIVGADSLPELHLWKDVGRIFSVARVVVVNRPGHDPEAWRPELVADVDPRAAERYRDDQVVMAPSPVSSTQVREAIRAGRPVDGLVPPVVARYVAEHGLYRDDPED